MDTHYQLEGPVDAPVLVLSHSLGSDLTTWSSQVPAFAKYFRVLRYDTRGHGQSPVPPGPYSMDDLTQDVVDLLDRLAVAKAHFCGISMGGTVGMQLALRHPHRVHRLVLANTAASFGAPEAWDARIDLVRRAGLGALLPNLLQRWFTPAFQSHPRVSDTRETVLRTPLEGYVGCCAAVRDVDVRGRLGTLSVPTLVLGGAHDPGRADAVALADQIPGARYVELDAAHLSSVECPQDFSDAVLAFLLR